ILNLQMDLYLARARSIPEGNPRRKAELAEVHGQLRELATLDQSIERNESLAVLALELNDPRLGAQLYAKIAAQRSADAARYFALAAKWSRAAGDNVLASRYYDAASLRAPTPNEARADAIEAIHALEAADDVPASADLAARYASMFP